MRLRQMAVAFLINEEHEILFLQKKQSDTFLAGFLVPIGGHIENNEINEPKTACLREIEEETGIKSDAIKNLALRYIVLRIKEMQEIRIQYVFFGDVLKGTNLNESNEGELSWIENKNILNHNVSATTKEIIVHYDKLGKCNEQVYVGSMKSLNGEPEITWGLLEDWEQPIVY
ncbi:NUDIX domain-containing protein [Bacillus sp. BGMRC 2118]|nr:NUDIX domain-containing protein [Bacillus sp. BGMRC 2118]